MNTGLVTSPSVDHSDDTRTLRCTRLVGIAVIVLAMVIGVVLSLAVGAVPVALSEVIAAIMGTSESPARNIVMDARLPRAICALLVGCNLAVAGVLLQSVTRNPLADPGLIGVTAGAGVAASIVLAVVPAAAASLPAAAFVGAMVSAVFVYAVSWRPGGGASPVRMILAGVAVNAILGALIGFLITAFADRIPAVMFWTTGSFNGRSWDHVEMLLPYSAVGLGVTLLIHRSMRVLALGDDAARSMGVPVERTRLVAFTAAALLAGSAVSVAGMIGFVGLVVPHVVRMLLGSNRAVVPVSVFAGGAIMLWSDLVSRTVLAPSELPVGVVTGLIGGPYFVYLLYRSGWLR